MLDWPYRRIWAELHAVYRERAVAARQARARARERYRWGLLIATAAARAPYDGGRQAQELLSLLDEAEAADDDAAAPPAPGPPPGGPPPGFTPLPLRVVA